MKLQRKNRRALALGALAVSGALALTACGSDHTGDNNGGGATSTAKAGNIDCGDAKGQLQASGSSSSLVAQSATRSGKAGSMSMCLSIFLSFPVFPDAP